MSLLQLSPKLEVVLARLRYQQLRGDILNNDKSLHDAAFIPVSSFPQETGEEQRAQLPSTIQLPSLPATMTLARHGNGMTIEQLWQSNGMPMARH